MTFNEIAYWLNFNMFAICIFVLSWSTIFLVLTPKKTFMDYKYQILLTG